MSRPGFLLVVLMYLLTPGEDTCYAQWLKAGLDADSVTALLCVPNGAGGTNLFAGTLTNGAFRSTDNGVTWVGVNSGLISHSVSALAYADSDLFALSNYDGVSVFRSTDQGANWMESNVVGRAENEWGYCLTSAKDSNGETMLFAGTATNIYRTTNDGAGWSRLNIPFSGYILALVEGSDQKLYAGNGGEEEGAGHVYVSTDGGTEWTWISQALGAHMVYCLITSPDGTRGTNLFAGTWGGGVYLSTNNGADWTQVNAGIRRNCGDCPYDNSIDIDAFVASGTNVFAGSCFTGVYRWDNGNKNWTDASLGLGDSTIRALAISDSYLFAAGSHGGVWRRPLTEIATFAESAPYDAPTQFGLAQNYPNPFNPNTTIRYALPERSYVRLTIYDITGREISILINGEQEAGTREVVFDAASLASGVYFYRLEAGKFVQTRKLLLMK